MTLAPFIHHPIGRHCGRVDQLGGVGPDDWRRRFGGHLHTIDANRLVIPRDPKGHRVQSGNRSVHWLATSARKMDFWWTGDLSKAFGSVSRHEEESRKEGVDQGERFRLSLSAFTFLPSPLCLPQCGNSGRHGQRVAGLYSADPSGKGNVNGTIRCDSRKLTMATSVASASANEISLGMVAPSYVFRVTSHCS